jgi:filamentous hemagglutinin family protein
MTSHQTRPNASPRRESFIVLSRTAFLRRALLTGTSALALMLGAPDLAEARYYGSSGSSSATTIASDAAQAAAQQAAAIAKRSQESLARTTQALQAMQAAQAAARNAAQGAASAVTNGLSPGGLVVDPRVTAGTGSNLWVNANLPTQSTGNGQTTVTIKQTAQRALMTWQQFNVGRNTTVDFDQSGGNSATGNSWIALNRIDATGAPSQIQGQIKADGTVLLINPNGIIFSGTSQINVHTLIASAMDMNSFTGTTNGAFKANGDAYLPVLVNGLAQTTPGGTAILAPSDEANANKTFLNNGLFINSAFQAVINGSLVSTGNSALFSAALIPGQSNIGVRVEAGASITTNVSGFDNGGFVALLGPQVTNAGSITTSAGEIILAAGNRVQIAAPAANSSQTVYAVRVGSGISGTLLYTPPTVSGGSLALNDASGLLTSHRGNITLIGDAVEQFGLAEATTSITRAGSITIAANGTGSGNQVIFGAGSVTAILPEENGETISSDAASLANFTAPRIDVAAPYVDFKGGSLIFAPSANMTVTGPGQGNEPDGSPPLPVGRVLMEAGSTIDLSGLTTTRSVADYLYTFKVTANDVADTPLAKNLIGQTVTIDLSLTGTRADGETWVGSPLFASSGAGYLANVAQGIDQLLSKGGSLNLTPGVSVGNGLSTGAFTDVLQAAGSVVNVSGGLIQYTGARIATTQLIGSDGRFYDIGKADPFLTNVIASGGFTVEHQRAGITEYYSAPLHGRGYDKPGYVNGLSAGSLGVTAVNPIIEGDLVGDIVIGTQQRQLAQAATGAGGAQLTPDQLPKGASLSFTLAGAQGGENLYLLHNAVVLDDKAPSYLGSGTSMASELTFPTNADGVPVLTISADRLSNYKLGSITISGADKLSMAEGASLSVLAGGSIKLANVTTIDGALIAHGGSIGLSGASVSSALVHSPGTLPETATFPALIIGATGLLDVSGQWINDTGHYSDDYTGALYVNGGNVSLSTTNLSSAVSYDPDTMVVTATDYSPSIVLQRGSVIDVSSGGYVGVNGKVATGSDGLPKGNGGNLTLLTYSGEWSSSTGVDPSSSFAGGNWAPQTATNANVIMDGTIYAGGLSQGGTLTLQVPEIVIDGNATQVTSITSGDRAGTVVLPTSFFTDSGFGSFKLTSTYGGTTVTAGTTLTLKQQNYLAPTTLPGSGARLRDFATLGFAPDGMRHAVNLALTESAYNWGVAGDRSATARLLIDEGARIVGDPLARISLTAGGPAIVLGSITAHGGSITVNQGFTPRTPLAHDGLPQNIWIGEDAVLDVSGTFVRDPKVTAYATGTVHAGGSISLSSVGVIVALAGSRFDISGASGTVEIPNAASGFGASPYVTQAVWSNGGSLTLNSVGDIYIPEHIGSLYFGGTIDAAGGAPQAAGGTLNVSNNLGILVSQSGDVSAPFAAAILPTTRTQLRSLLPTTTATSFITADTINSANSGLDTVSFSGRLNFSGDVDLKLAGSILINNASNGTTTLLPTGVVDTSYTASCASSGGCIPSIGATNVTLEAGYIRLANSDMYIVGALYPPNPPKLADGTLTLNAAQQIDLVGVLAVDNASTVNLVSGGDIRLIGTNNFSRFVATGAAPAEAVSDGYGGMPYVGALLVADNLNLTARTIYPTTDTAFLLMSLGLAPSDAAGVHNTIAIASNGKAPVAPLSAGGAIIVDARTIVQGGALYAPLGTIQLGFGAGQTLPSIFIDGPTNNPYNPVKVRTNFAGLYGSMITTVATESVTLAPGSITSVSANGLTIPYGTTTDGTDWTDNNTLLNGPPAKLIALGGSRVDSQAGAIIDGSGGGDIYATEFVPGTGGSRNVLTTNTQTVYALVPGYQSALAPYDAGFTTSVAAGTTVTLPGGNGIPAGTYTLLPAEYATLPGAYRVAVVSTNINPSAQTITTPDGSVYMTGVIGNAINGSSSSQTAMLQIQSNAVWTQYSQIDIATGDKYFAQLATSNGTAVPRLAQDAARLVVAAGTALALNGENRFAPASGGLGGQLDITGSNLVVAASDQLGNFGTISGGAFTPGSDYAGYLFLDADMLSGLGIESTLIGGYRSNTSEGTLITATALNLEIATDAAHPLTGPELLFTSLAPTSADPSVRGLVVDDGSVITAKGTVSGSSSSALVVGVDPTPTYDYLKKLVGYSAGVSGDGALLRVSNGGMVDVVRHFVPGVYKSPETTPPATPPVSSITLAKLTIGNNVALSGNTLTLDTSGDSTVSATASLTAKNYDLSGRVINLGGGTGGLVITTDLIGKLAGADSVRLRSASVFNLYGSNSFGDGSNRIGTLTFDGAGLYSDGRTTTITAGNIVLANSQATANTDGANTSGSGGSLVLDASGALTFGKGTKTLSGFASVTATAGSEALFTGKGSLDAKGANVTLTAPLVLADKASTQSLKTTGLLTLAQGAGTAPAVAPTVIGGALAFTGGSINASGTLIAQGGKLTLEATTGDLELSGNARLSAAGTRITIGNLIQDTPAGSIRLYADAGNVTLGSGTTVDVSGAGSGYAGSLAIYAAKTAGLRSTLKGGARYSDLGGAFTLIADRLAGGLPLGAGFTRSFEVSLGQGDIAIGAGETLKSENVLLVANNGDVRIDGTIDASSASGGTIGLYGTGTSTAAAGTAGASGVTIGSGAKLYARYRAPDKDSPGYAGGTATNVQRGGTITLGTTGTPDGTLDPTYGYQNVPGSGAITVASGAIFDVSGGAGGTDIDNTGGSVIIRAPILANNAINVAFNGIVVTNAKADGSASGQGLVANAFAVWSTTDNGGAAGPRHFDGIIDPAGWFDSAGTRIAGDTDSTTGIFSPSASVNADHVAFYQTTLLGFVNNPFDTSAVAARFAGAKLKVGSNAAIALPSSMLHLRPEIGLVNPSASINNGNITVASNWNFGAGTMDRSGNINLLYRTTNGAEPGTLTLRAANNIKINATVSDGFFFTYKDTALPDILDASSTTTEHVPTATESYNNEIVALSDGSTSPLGLNYFGLLNGDDYYYYTQDYRYLSKSDMFGNGSYVPLSLLGSATLQAPTIFSNPTNDLLIASLIDQYNQYYYQYTRLFDVYAKETQYNEVRYAIPDGVAPYQPPAAPTAAAGYSNLQTGAQPGTGNDYVSLYQQYLIETVTNTNAGSLSASSFVAGSGWLPNDQCSACVAVAAPFAPVGQLADSIQPGYVETPPVSVTVTLPRRLSAPVTTDMVDTIAGRVINAIANNPSAVNLDPLYGISDTLNTTSSANLMTAAVSGKGSFSYDFVGGALFNADGASSVNPNAVVQLSSLSPTVTGNVTIDGHTSYTNPLNYRTVVVPSLVRTGTGSITIAAAGDFALLDVVSPGAVYTAGYVADNADGFTAPTLGAATVSSGLLTTPVWATGGGNITVAAGRDIVGIETPVDPTGSQFSAYMPDGSIGVSTGQFWSAWYYVNGKWTGSSTAPFDPLAGGEQYSSWINYGTFFQGFGALGGGNITLKAGRNVQDVSASLPETIQVSGGQSAVGAAAAAHYYGGGNLLVEAGNDVLSGLYYVGRGTGLIRAGGDVTADATLHETIYGSDFAGSYDQPAVRYTEWVYDDQGGATRVVVWTPEISVPLLLAVQDSQISVQAAGDITLGGVFEPTALPVEVSKNVVPDTTTQDMAAQTLTAHIGAVFNSYGANSGVSLRSSAGSISVGANALNTLFMHTPTAYFGAESAASGGAPASLFVTALTGDISIPSGISLYQSATSELSLVAGGSINVDVGGGVTMSDGNSALAGPAAVLTAPLHAGDDEPVIIYAGEDINGGSYTLLKKARVWAGRDILNVAFTGMNTSDDDITSIIAGRDILATLQPDVLERSRLASRSIFTLYGPGDFVIEAGRNLGPFSTYDAASIADNPLYQYGGGIFAIGDGANYNTSSYSSLVKSYLPQKGADITLRYGVGGGTDYAAAIAKYGDAATAAASGIDVVPGIIPKLEQVLADLIVKQAKASGITNPSVTVTLTPAEAAELFTALATLGMNEKLAALAEKAGLSGLSFNLRPSDFHGLLQAQESMKLAIDRSFLDLLTKVSLDYNNAASPYFGKYARAYEAIATLFPASLGYTDNSGGGSGASPVLKHTGDLRMARSLVETQTGGDINLLGPGGSAYVGSNAADTLSPSQQGILTLQGGSVRTYNDGSVLIYQSRIFTEQGGNIEMFSGNGDLNAGKGPKSSSAYPPLKLVCDTAGYCRVSPAGLVTGAGIGALISVPGQDPTKSNVYLSAPHGRIDFGAAGGRSAGELNLVAQQVLNAFNVQVGGATVGIPTVQGPPVAALSTASNATAATQQSALPSGQSNSNGQSTVMIVEIIGYGGAQGAEEHDDDERRRRAQ